MQDVYYEREKGLDIIKSCPSKTKERPTVFQQKNLLMTRWNAVHLSLHSFVLDGEDPDLDAQ